MLVQREFTSRFSYLHPLVSDPLLHVGHVSHVLLIPSHPPSTLHADRLQLGLLLSNGMGTGDDGVTKDT